MDSSENCCCCQGASDQEAANGTCPVCKNGGIAVANVTVGKLVRDEYQSLVASDGYRICMESSCSVVYFSDDGTKRFTKDQVRVPIWFKDGADPKYACYCSEVTEQQVLDAVHTLPSDSLSEIIKATGAMKNSNCLERNPLGVCCHAIIEEAIAKANFVH